MKIRRIPRTWNPATAIAKASIDKGLFLHDRAMCGESIVEDLTALWQKTIPVQMEAYRTDAPCECGQADCEACATDDDCLGPYGNNTEITIPDWEDGEGIIMNPTYAVAPTGSHKDGWGAFERANAEFFAAVHFYMPEVLAFIHAAETAMETAEACLIERQDILMDKDDLTDAEEKQLERIEAALDLLDRLV